MANIKKPDTMEDIVGKEKIKKMKKSTKYTLIFICSAVVVLATLLGLLFGLKVINIGGGDDDQTPDAVKVTYVGAIQSLSGNETPGEFGNIEMITEKNTDGTFTLKAIRHNSKQGKMSYALTTDEILIEGIWEEIDGEYILTPTKYTENDYVQDILMSSKVYENRALEYAKSELFEVTMDDNLFYAYLKEFNIGNKRYIGVAVNDAIEDYVRVGLYKTLLAGGNGYDVAVPLNASTEGVALNLLQFVCYVYKDRLTSAQEFFNGIEPYSYGVEGVDTAVEGVYDAMFTYVEEEGDAPISFNTTVRVYDPSKTTFQLAHCEIAPVDINWYLSGESQGKEFPRPIVAVGSPIEEVVANLSFKINNTGSAIVLTSSMITGFDSSTEGLGYIKITYTNDTTTVEKWIEIQYVDGLVSDTVYRVIDDEVLRVTKGTSIADFGVSYRFILGDGSTQRGYFADTMVDGIMQSANISVSGYDPNTLGFQKVTCTFTYNDNKTYSWDIFIFVYEGKTIRNIYGYETHENGILGGYVKITFTDDTEEEIQLSNDNIVDIWTTSVGYVVDYEINGVIWHYFDGSGMRNW